MSSRILVVDDEDAFRQTLTSRLKRDGHEVDSAEDGEKAIKMLQSKLFDLALLDIRMPGIDGIGMLKFVKKHSRSTDVIMLTGYGDIRLAVESMKLGASEFITKPIEPEGLTARVRSVLRAHDAEQAKERAKQELEQAKADFTAMLVHELRSPLVGIEASLSFIRKADPYRPLDQVHFDLLNAGIATSEKMLRLINDILYLSKLEAGKLHLAKMSVDFREIVEFTCKSMRSPIDAKRFRLERNFMSDLPKVDVDPDQMGQVMMNFVSNSIKFTAEGGRISISVDAEEVADDIDARTRKQLVVCVADTGVGIAKEEIPFLFEKYKQTKAGKLSKDKGIGLGLAINKRIIEAHGGNVWVDSEVNKGTSFHFTIPVSSSTSPAESAHG
ncbi:MAG: sensor histidine kinase [Bacteroidota bacterium]